MSVTTERDAELAIVTIDNPPVNALSQAVRQGLMDAVAAFEGDAAVRAVVLLCAGRTFIAGADISEFGKPPAPPHLPDVIAAIEASTKPWIAAIHGAALGGGLEVALGCRFRVAAPSARLGLPEVTLGVVPGAGGTVRLPRLVALDLAVEMITGGRPIPAARAAEVGLVDAVLAGDLRAEALAFARQALARPLPAPLAHRPPPRPEPGFWEAQARVIGARARGQVAPLKALECVRKAAEADPATAFAFERQTFLALRDAEEARALRHVFFAERAAVRPPAIEGIEPRPLNRVGIVGGGTMGTGIAAALRDAGIPVVLLERDREALARAEAQLRGIYDSAVARGRLGPEAREARLSGVHWSTEAADLADADLVIEAVFEDLDVKRALFARLGSACRADAILATNTSYLDPRAIFADIPGPERCIGLHFFSPAQVMKLVEIVPLPQTSPEVLATGFALAQRLRKIPVRSGICEGFIGNRILKRYRAAAETLLREGVAVADVDAAMRAFGYAMGPFEAQDLGGLDIAGAQRAAARAAGRDVPETLADILLRAGRKGQKTGGGWYDYQPGERRPQASAEVSRLLAPHVAAPIARPPETIAARLVAEMADEGAAILAEGIADTPASIDLVTIHGYGFPRWRGGLMYHAASAREALAAASGRPFGAALARFLGGPGGTV